MISKEEIEEAKDNILRGNDIESACLIMQAAICGNLVQIGGRVNIVKVAMRQILNFIEEYKNKGYLDVVREKVQLKEKNKQLEQENSKQNKMIDEMLDEYEYNARCNLNNFCDEEMRKDKCIQDCRICIKQYFEKKVGGELNES